VQVEQALIQLGQPMLLVISEGVDRAQEPDILLAQPEMLTRETQAFLEAD
jgi:hypothetical protein